MNLIEFHRMLREHGRTPSLRSCLEANGGVLVHP